MGSARVARKPLFTCYGRGCLEKNPRARFDDAGQLGKALSALA